MVLHSAVLMSWLEGETRGILTSPMACIPAKRGEHAFEDNSATESGCPTARDVTTDTSRFI